MKKFLILLLMFLPLLTSCGNDDEPEVDASEIQGVWECTSCTIENIEGLNGMVVPDVVTNILKEQMVNNMIGDRITISSGVKVNGDVVLFPESGIKWKILSLTDKKMTVRYDTSSSSGSYGMNMTIKADYKKVK